MSSFLQPVFKKFTAGVEMIGKQYRWMQISDEEGKLVGPADGSKSPVGILYTGGDIAAGDSVSVAVDGEAILMLAEAVSPGQFVGSDADGLGVVASSYTGGYVMQAGAIGQTACIKVERSKAGEGGDSGGPYTGFSIRFNEAVNLPNNEEAIEYILNLGYAGPLANISASPSAATLREKGDEISSVTLTSVSTKRSNPITSKVFRRAGTPIFTVPTPNPAGGSDNTTDTDPFSDNLTFDVQVGDGVTTTTASLAFAFVYPYFYGVGAPGLNVAGIQALTKDIRNNGNNIPVVFSPTAQVYYFAYPAAYGALTSILDTNGFETLPDWTPTTRDFVGLDGTTQSYRVYEFKNVTTQTSFTNTFKK